MKRHFLIAAGVLLAFVGFGQNYPFPMNEQGYSYPYGISATNPSNSTIQSKFLAWEKAMYTENSAKTQARIKYDDGTSTVSEGIAYGMLIYVYMANATNTQCQDHFDKLYAYYKTWSNNNGLMNWKITGFEKVDANGYNGATDADLDVALALCLAAKQWESSSKYVYADEAERLLNAIYNRETFNKNGLRLFKPGDSWDNIGNPCYFTVASVGAFVQAQEKLGFVNTKNWTTVYKDSHTYLEKTQRGGVWPNWSDWSYNPGKRSWGDDEDYDFGWDACRVPWRVAWDYVWFGNESSKNMMAKTIELLDTKGWQNSPGSVGFFTGLTSNSYSAIKLSSNHSYSAGNVAWTGSVGCAFMTDESRQENLDTYYKQNCNKTGAAYYAQTLQVLYMLTLSGNAANFFDCDAGAANTKPAVVSAATDGSAIVLNTSKKLQSSNNYSDFSLYVNGNKQSNAFTNISVSDKEITLALNGGVSIEENDLISISYNGTTIVNEDNIALGEMVRMSVKNTLSSGTILADCETDVCSLGGSWFTYDDNSQSAQSTISPKESSDLIVAGGQSGKAVKISFSLNKGSYQYDPFVGFGFSLLSDDTQTYNCSNATGVKFYHKGSAISFQVKIPNTQDNYHSVDVQQHSDWTPVEVKWSDLQQENGWGNQISFDATKVLGMQWQMKGTTGQSGEVWIDEVMLMDNGGGSNTTAKSELESVIVSSNTLYGSAAEESYPATAISNYRAAIESAAIVYDNPSASQTQIDNAISALQEATKTFKSQEIKVVDKSILRKSITTATMLKENSVVGNENGQFPQLAMDELVAAIAAANGVYESASATEMEVSEASTTLNTAIQKFRNSEISRADKTELKKYIDLATDILATTEAGTAYGQYDAKKRSSLESTLRSANVQYEKETASQTTIDLVAGNLKSAYENYKNSKVTTTAIDETVCTVSVFPNPCTNVLNIEVGNEIGLVRIIGISGSKMEYPVENQSTIQIPVSHLANGFYTIQILFTNGTQSTIHCIKK